MSVTEVVQAVGAWDLTLSPDIPKDVLDGLDYFGHVAVVSGRVDPRQVGDGMLTAARYVGVLRRRAPNPATPKISGLGMSMWLGDDDKGDVFETAVELVASSFATAINALLPDAVTAGTIHTQPGTIDSRIQWQTPKKAITYVAESFGAGGLAEDAVEWRVNGNATLDAGKVSELYGSTPSCVISRRASGYDMRTRGLKGAMDVTRDSEDFTSRLVLMGEGSGVTVVIGTANNGANPYKDLHGNTLKMTRIVSESNTAPSSADSRAALALAAYSGTNDQLSMSTTDYDVISAADETVPGSFSVGDMVWVWDPDSALVDTNNEITFRGERINPIKLRITEATWPVTAGCTVAYRSATGVWTDLTDYVVWETGDTRLTVGAFQRTLSNASLEPVSWRPAVDTTIPGTPVFVTPFIGATYLDARGYSRAKIRVKWSAPLNTDGSVILDGDRYEIRYRVDTDIIYPATWGAMAGTTWGALDTWGQPIAYPDQAWHIVIAAYGTTEITVQDLAPGVGYDFEIRLVDQSSNAGAWSATTTVTASPDTQPPTTPAAPTVAASRIAIQVSHTLGKATGGTYNLENDLDHLDVHVSNEATYIPGPTTLVGKLRANEGMLLAQIKAIGTFNVEETSARWVKVVAVDLNGNASNASVAASATAALIDDAHISDLTVTKVTAGTISADWIVGARIKTADSGARVELNVSGLQAFNAAGTQTVDIAAATGNVSIIGQLSSGTAADRVVINPTGSSLPDIRFYPTTGTDYASITSSTSGGNVKLVIQGGIGSGNRAKSTFFADATELVIVDGTDSWDGGRLALSAATALVGYTDATVTAEMQFTNTGHFWLFGRWPDFVNLGATQGIFTGGLSATATDITVSYGTTSSTGRRPICQHNDTLGIGSISPLQVNTVIATSFDAEVNNFQGVGWDLYFWVFRI